MLTGQGASFARILPSLLWPGKPPVLGNLLFDALLFLLLHSVFGVVLLLHHLGRFWRDFLEVEEFLPAVFGVYLKLSPVYICTYI